MILDLSLANELLWIDCEIAIVAGKAALLTPTDNAIDLLGRRLGELAVDPDEVTLTGGMAIWAYLVAFHFLHGKTRRIYYQDGRGDRFLVAAHG